MSGMKAAIATLLRTHAYPDAERVLEAANGQVDLAIVSIGTTFSRPLLLSRFGAMLQLAHYTTSTYDIDLAPLVTFTVTPSGDWVPQSLFRFHEGLRVVGQAISPAEMEQMLAEWAVELLENGYNDRSQALLQVGPQRKSVEKMRQAIE